MLSSQNLHPGIAPHSTALLAVRRCSWSSSPCLSSAAAREPPLRIPLSRPRLSVPSRPSSCSTAAPCSPCTSSTRNISYSPSLLHRLIPRLPDEPEDDRDRVVDAVLLDLPSRPCSRPHLLAPTRSRPVPLEPRWRPLFTPAFATPSPPSPPLINLATGQPFTQLSLSRLHPSACLWRPSSSPRTTTSSSSNQIKRAPVNKTPKTPLFGPSQSLAPMLKERDPVQINFYRLRSTETSDAVQAAFAGIVQSDSTGDIPASTAGFLAVIDQGHQHYAFDFHSYAGKVAELSPFDSSCSPAPIFVSHSEFIAFGCRGGQVRQQVGGFNMRGEEMWEQGIFGDYISPSLAYAPAGGRFALSRILLKNSVIADQPLSSRRGQRTGRYRLPDRHRQAAPPRRLLSHRTRRPELYLVPRRPLSCRSSRRRHRDLTPSRHSPTKTRPHSNSSKPPPLRKTIFPSTSPPNPRPLPTRTQPAPPTQSTAPVRNSPLPPQPSPTPPASRPQPRHQQLPVQSRPSKLRQPPRRHQANPLATLHLSSTASPPPSTAFRTTNPQRLRKPHPNRKGRQRSPVASPWKLYPNSKL